MRQSGSSKCGIIGIITLVLGGTLLFFGSRSAYTLGGFDYRYGGLNGTGRAASIGGIVLVTVGIALVIICLYTRSVGGRRFSGTMHNHEYDGVDDVMLQLAGSRTIFGVFYSEDNSRALSVYRDNTCILKEGDSIRRGRIEPVTQPDHWRATVDAGDGEQRYEISRADANLLIKSDRGEEIFYRR